MRISVDSNDPGFIRGHRRYKVYLNGEEQRYCITADEEKGEVIVHIKGPDGNFLIDGDEFKRAVLYGTVKIVEMAE